MKKYYKKFTALAAKNTTLIILVLIIFLGAYLRLNDFHNLARFNADQVRDAKIIDQMALGKDFPLLGPKAGGTTFKLGPAFYYLQYISGSLFGFTPAGIALFIPLLSVASIFLFYMLMRKNFEPNIALVLTFLYSTSFYAIKYSRFAWNPNAIPFFVFAYFLLADRIINQKAKIYHHLLFAMTIGIGMQLHTTLLIIFPTFAVLTYTYSYIKNKSIPLTKIFAALLLVIFLNLPFLYFDLLNDGKNVKSFFEGISTKTEKSESLSRKILTDVEFFAQGATYIMTGYEPGKRWINPLKVIKSKSPVEIATMSSSISFLILGFYFWFKKFQNKKLKEINNITLLTLSFTLFSFLLFLPLSSELNIRFFIVIIFLPYILFGYIIEKIIKLKINKLSIFFIAILAIFLTIINVKKYQETYNLDNYKAKEAVYGGISLSEAEGISKWMIDESKKYPDRQSQLMKFEYEKSIEYFNSKAHFSIRQVKDKEIKEDTVIFFIADKNNDADARKKFAKQFTVLKETNMGRFEILLLLPNSTHKIGFITDIHGKLSKKHNYDLDIPSLEAIRNFNVEMNEVFKPEFIV